jgi:hypothetical protein
MTTYLRPDFIKFENMPHFLVGYHWIPLPPQKSGVISLEKLCVY